MPKTVVRTENASIPESPRLGDLLQHHIETVRQDPATDDSHMRPARKAPNNHLESEHHDTDDSLMGPHYSLC